jgi:hypothetical protein
LASVNVRPLFSPRPIAVVCSWSKPISNILPLPLPAPTWIETCSPFFATLTAAAVWPLRLAFSIADPTSPRSEPTMPAAPSTTISGV